MRLKNDVLRNLFFIEVNVFQHIVIRLPGTYIVKAAQVVLDQHLSGIQLGVDLGVS